MANLVVRYISSATIGYLGSLAMCEHSGIPTVKLLTAFADSLLVTGIGFMFVPSILYARHHDGELILHDECGFTLMLAIIHILRYFMLRIREWGVIAYTDMLIALGVIGFLSALCLSPSDDSMHRVLTIVAITDWVRSCVLLCRIRGNKYIEYVTPFLPEIYSILLLAPFIGSDLHLWLIFYAVLASTAISRFLNTHSELEETYTFVQRPITSILLGDRQERGSLLLSFEASENRDSESDPMKAEDGLARPMIPSSPSHSLPDLEPTFPPPTSSSSLSSFFSEIASKPSASLPPSFPSLQPEVSLFPELSSSVSSTKKATRQGQQEAADWLAGL